MIAFENVSMRYPADNGREPVPVLEDVNLSVKEGEFVCVLGPSGCGKTTLLNLIAGFIRPTGGRVLFGGRLVGHPGPQRAVVFQDPTLFPWLTVRQNVEFGLRYRGVERGALAERVESSLGRVGLEGWENARVHELSGGMRQRAALARVLVLDPPALLMDEPFGSLDANTREHLQEELLRVEASRFNSGPACPEALYSGSADVGTMGDTTAVIAVSRNRGFVIIASHGAGEHRHRIVVPEASPLREPEDLLGHRLAVKKGTSTYGGLLAFCADHGIDVGKINVIDMRPGEMTEALLAGSIDAFVASEPTPSLAQARGARELATLGGLGNHYPILIVARRDFLRNRPDEAAAFMRAMRRRRISCAGIRTRPPTCSPASPACRPKAPAGRCSGIPTACGSMRRSGAAWPRPPIFSTPRARSIPDRTGRPHWIIASPPRRTVGEEFEARGASTLSSCGCVS